MIQDYEKARLLLDMLASNKYKDPKNGAYSTHCSTYQGKDRQLIKDALLKLTGIK